MKKFIIMPEKDMSGIFDDVLTPSTYNKLNLPKKLENEFKGWIKFYVNECLETKRHILKEDKVDLLNKKGKKLALKVKKLYPENKIFYLGKDEIGYLLIEVINLPK
jgi:hypothetical protein